MTVPISNHPLKQDTVATDDPSNRGICFLEEMNVPPATSAGRYTVRFAQTVAEIEAAQALRYRVSIKKRKATQTMLWFNISVIWTNGTKRVFILLF